MRQNRATHVSLCSARKQWIENPLVLSILRCLPALSLGAHGCRAAARSGRLLDDLVCLLSSTTIERNVKGVLDASTSIRILLIVLKCRSSEQHFSYSFPAILLPNDGALLSVSAANFYCYETRTTPMHFTTSSKPRHVRTALACHPSVPAGIGVVSFYTAFRCGRICAGCSSALTILVRPTRALGFSRCRASLCLRARRNC